MPKEIWKEVAKEAENQMHGISTLLKLSKEVKTWAATIVKELIKKVGQISTAGNKEKWVKIRLLLTTA